MGYCIQDDPVARSCNPENAWPGFCMQKRGQRFYTPALGRWINRSKSRRDAHPCRFNATHPRSHQMSRLVRFLSEDGIDLASEETGLSGQTRCNYEEGTLGTSVSKDSCAGNCAQRHENVHRAQRESCCAKVKEWCDRSPDNCESYKNKYKEWVINTSGSAECSAYIETAACLLSNNTADLHCDCKKEMSGLFQAVSRKAREYCSQYGLFDIAATPCPLP